MKKILILIRKILINKVIFYIATRYVTYAIQFAISFFIAAKLGPYNFGIWGFVLLLLNYLTLINFGISNSVNILLVQNKTNKDKTENIIKTSLYLTGCVCILIILFTVYYYICGIALFDKYSLKPFFYLITIIGILTHFNNLYSTIARVKNDIFRVAFFQSIIPILCFITIFWSKESTLIFFILIAYILGNIFSFALFITDNRITYCGIYNRHDAELILKKGSLLFIYNLAFYLIIISTKTIISLFFKVEEYGFFSFTYILANSVLLLLNAFSFIVFPKLIDKLKSKDTIETQYNIYYIQSNLVTLAHGFMYVIIVLYPIVLLLLPKYGGTVSLFHFLSLTILMSVNSTGFTTFLMAQNKERLLSILAFSALMLNVSGVLFITLVLKQNYEYVILATLITYSIYSFMIVYFSKKMLTKIFSVKSLLSDFMPLNLFLPFLFSLFIVLLGKYSIILNVFCVFLFLIFNVKELKKIIITIKQLINKPTIINI